MSAAAIRHTVGNVLQAIALGVGVTMLGILGGAMLVAPAMPRDQLSEQLARMPREQLLMVGGLLATVAVLALGIRMLRRRGPGRAGRGAATPTMTQRGGRVSKTPRHVQALAAAGDAPAEIAWKTGLPVDAVAMLLNLSGARQVPPPLA